MKVKFLTSKLSNGIGVKQQTKHIALLEKFLKKKNDAYIGEYHS